MFSEKYVITLDYNNITVIFLIKKYYMDLSQYKHIRTKKFPLPKTKTKHQQILIPSQRPIHTMALISSHTQQTYQIHQQKENKNNVIIFNQHQYIKRTFDCVYKLKQTNNEDIVKNIMDQLERQLNQNQNNLIIYNALDLTPIQELIFPWRQHVKLRVQSSQDKIMPYSTLRTIIQSTLKTKRSNTVITLSVLGIHSDGSIQDQLNYQWIEQSQYIQDLLKIKQKTKLKIKKYKSQIKTFDLNRQQIKQWKQAQQILFHYSQIKEYLQCWSTQLVEKQKQTPKIGQMYQVCQVLVDQQLGYIKNVYKRKILVKLNQFMQESNLIITKLTQNLKQRIKNIPSINTRDNQFIMYLKDCFDKDKNYYYTLLSQLGTNQSLKQQAICLNMDIQMPGYYLYLKNYCDKPDILAEVKQFATNFIPLTIQQRSSIKIQSTQNGMTKLKPKTKNIIKQSQAITGKLFYLDTYSSNEKKRSIYGSNKNTYSQLNQIFQGKVQQFGPYQRLLQDKSAQKNISSLE